MQVFPVSGLLLALVFQYCGCLPIDAVPGPLIQYDFTLASAYSSRVKKSTGDTEYLEECAFVESWQEQPGRINVLAFLDASWEYSHRQAIMLKMLQDRFISSGITEIQFFVINSARAGAAIDNVDVEDEREAWSAAEPTEGQNFSKIEKTRETLKSKIDPDIIFVQDTDELKIWDKLSASRDQVLVIDKCGRLSYRVIVPWSILHFPYVKAAILSTYKEQPCGLCNINNEENVTIETTTAALDEESQTEQLSDLLPQNFNIDQMKEIVVKKYNLDKTDSTVTKVYHSKEPQDIPESIIELLNGSASVKQRIAQQNFENRTENEALLQTEVSNVNNSCVIASSQASITAEVNNDSGKFDFRMDTFNSNKNTELQNDEDSSSTFGNDSSDTFISTTIHGIEGIDAAALTASEGIRNNNEEQNSKMDSLVFGVNEFVINCASDGDSKTETSEPLTENQTSNNINKVLRESGEISSEGHSQNADNAIPIKIIMHAPHIHEYEEPKRKYEYLVLKLGNPEYHGHLEPDDDLIESIDSTATPGSDDKSKENYELETVSQEDGGSRDEENLHPGHRHHHKDGHGKSKSKHLKSIYDKDESPGFYGEDSEYWRKIGNTEYQEYLQTEHTSKKIGYTKGGKEGMRGYDAVHVQHNPDIDSGSEINTEFKISISADQDSQMDDYVKLPENTSNEVTTKEEEITNCLIEHYSKLIPWLNYVFQD